jgi:predicted MPP superfamily phosphohydrolase
MSEPTATLAAPAHAAEGRRRSLDPRAPDCPEFDQLAQRFGSRFVRQRLGIEDDHEARARRGCGQRLRRWYLSPVLVRRALKLSGLYWHARNNAERIRVRRHSLFLRRLPAAFDGYTILQISDLHVDISPGPMRRLAELLPRLSYDLCVLTGDYRGRTYGPYDATIAGLAEICARIDAPIYGVLGNHDSLRMAAALEAMGIRLLVNEATTITRGGARLHLAGIDDAHFYRTDNLEKAAMQIPTGGFAILLSHTPEIYRQAAHTDFDLLLSGHTHGGQICLPGAVALTLDATLPRRMGAGTWSYRGMTGYTSVGVGSSVIPARLNCPPEVTLHELRRAGPEGQ